MKKLTGIFLCFIILVFSVGCSNNTTTVKDGYYFAEGNYDKGLTPFIRFNIEHQTFSTSSGLYYDYIIWGNYEIKENILIANVEDNRHPNFKFEIKNQNTIVLIDNEDGRMYEDLINQEFKFSLIKK